MNDFKIGDKVKLKKLSEKEFREIYIKQHNTSYLSYNTYLNLHKNYFNQIYKIEEIDIDNSRIYFKNCNIIWFYKEEVEKISYIKTKFKIVKELLNDR